MDKILMVDEYLHIIEEIFKKYLDNEIEQDSLIFVKYERYPVVNKGILTKIKDNNLISNVPFSPYMSVACVKDMLLDKIYVNSARDISFKRNPFIPNGGNTNLVSEYECDSCTIENYLDNVTPEDTDEIIRWTDKLYHDVIHNEVRNNPNNIYDIDIESNCFILKDLGNVKTYRYDELMEYMENQKVSKEEYRETVDIRDYNKAEADENRRGKDDRGRRKRSNQPIKNRYY